MCQNKLQTLKVITLGCSKNQVDTEHLLAEVKNDFDIRPESYDGYCEYLLINTCGFIGDAKEESINTILRQAELKKEGKIGKLLVFGCLSQRYKDSMPELIPEVDGWYGAREIAPIIKDLSGRKVPESFSSRHMPSDNSGYAYLKISEGCNRSCSYCAIPFIRGKHRSVPIETLVKEAEALAEKGIKEIILIAQDTTFYGLDLYKRRALADLMNEISKVKGVEWIRLHYSYPADFPVDVLQLMNDNDKICKYLDIPLQHISDNVLSKMRRSIDNVSTVNLINAIRKTVPGIALRTTMIVGHPGEGENEFQELLDFVKTTEFERLGAFKYSEEEGTFGAQKFKDDIPDEIKDSRYDMLMKLQSEISLKLNKKRVGTIEKVMVDDYISGTLICRSQYESPEVDGEILVPAGGTSGVSKIKDPVRLIGNFINVKITDADEYDLKAEII